jgi:2-succinyl-5-enolpyruvyl-6-hydroxy-3-cyclohexene-1-carboxylate synthase
MGLSNLLTEWSALLFRSLADAGVRDVVISPGSRSTPFVVAAVREPRVTCHNVIDERAAAFFALGQARTSGVPSVLLCTSGTAAAHYLPAIIEASLSYVPLVVLTADRPTELQDCHAPQTIDQVKLFGGHVRHFLDLVPDAAETALLSVPRVAAQAVQLTTWPVPGAVHVNARARKPLEPVAPTNDEEHKLAAFARSLRTPRSFPPRTAPSPAGVEAVAEVCREARSGILVCGPAPLAQREGAAGIFALARATGFPIAAEATSQLRFAPSPEGVTFLDAFDVFFRSKAFRDAARPEVAIQIGAAPVSGSWEHVAPRTRRVVLAPHGWNDPHGNAAMLLHGEPGDSAAAVAIALREWRVPDTVRAATRRLAEAESRAWQVVDADVASSAFSEGAAVRVLSEELPDGSDLILGNSLAVRVIDAYCPRRDVRVGVLAQRGASGIDGLVAGAAGAAHSSRRPTTLLLGDVSLMHDLGSLALASRTKVPLVVLVLNNGGGRIFELLPIVDVPDIEQEIVEHATTPQQPDFETAARAFGIGYARAADASTLRGALREAWARPKATLVDVVVPPHGARAQHARIGAAVDAAVRPLLEGTT